MALLFPVVASTAFAADTVPQKRENITHPPEYHVAGLSENEALSKGVLLVAKPSLRDHRFDETVVLIISHNSQDGAAGVIINRPTNIPLSKALPDVKELKGFNETVFIGGPVSQFSLVMLFTSQNAPDMAEHVFGDVYLSIGMDGLNRVLAESSLTNTIRAYAGYTGWAPGQLEAEVERGDWRVVRAIPADIFDTPPEIIWRNFMVRFNQHWVKGYEEQNLMVSMRR